MPTLAGYLVPGYNLPTHALRPIPSQRYTPIPDVPKNPIPYPCRYITSAICGLALFLIHLHAPFTLSLFATFAAMAPFATASYHIWAKLFLREEKRRFRRLERAVDMCYWNSVVGVQEMNLLRWRWVGVPVLFFALRRGRRLREGGNTGVLRVEGESVY